MLSGMLRDNSSYESLKRDIIKPYGADVYCQLWSSSEQNAAAEANNITQSYNTCIHSMQLMLATDTIKFYLSCWA